MPKTDFDSGELRAQGHFLLPPPGWHQVAGRDGMGWPYAHWIYPDSAFSRTFSLGPISVSVAAVSGTWMWDPVLEQWNGPSGFPGFPAALGNPGTTRCANGFARIIRTSAFGPGGYDTQDEVVVWWKEEWDRGATDCLPASRSVFSPWENTTITGNNNTSDLTFPWWLTIDPIACHESLNERLHENLTGPPPESVSRANATCVQQLDNRYWWQGEVPWSAQCGSAMASATLTYNSVHLPVWTSSLTHAAGFLQFYQEYPGRICPGTWRICQPATSWDRLGSQCGTTWTLSGQYANLRASGSHIRCVDPAFGTSGTYEFSDGSMMVTITAANGSHDCCDPRPTDCSTGEFEWGRAWTKIGLKLAAFDQTVAVTSLKATATHFIEQDVEWNYETQRWEQAENYSTPRILDVPGTYTASFARTSRYMDRIVPFDEHDHIHVTLTDDSLRSLDLPRADNVMVLHDGALDRIGITGDWGAYNQYGGHYENIYKVGVQSPMCVQWAQDDRPTGGDPLKEPPSWWVHEYIGPLGRPTLLEATVNLNNLYGRQTIYRDFAWHPYRRDKNYLVPAPPGTHVDDLWKFIGDWSRVNATKHLRKGDVIGGPYSINQNDRVRDPENPGEVHMYYAYGVMPWSEDVTDWRAYRWVKFSISYPDAPAWTLTLKIHYEHDNVYDNYKAKTEDRKAGFDVQTSSDVATYTCRVPDNALREEIIFDLVSAGSPNLERIIRIEIVGMPGDYGTFTLHNLELLPPADHVRMEETDLRPVRWGGEPRYACGTGEYLGKAMTPEEYGGRWFLGGHLLFGGVVHPGRSIDIAPPYGIPFVNRRDTDCGKLQDRLKTFGAWFSDLVGTWGLEGFYGKHYTALTDSAMGPWKDENDSVLACVGGSGYITLIPHLFYRQMTSADFLNNDRDSDGPMNIPVVVRTGRLRPCEGINWATDGIPYWGGKSMLYGARVAIVTNGKRAPVSRVRDIIERDLSFSLYERDENTLATRLVDTRGVDLDSRLRWARGVNEFRHIEYGATAETDLDYQDRHDYRSGVMIPSGNPYESAIWFDDVHYQVLPTFDCIFVFDAADWTGRHAFIEPWPEGPVILAVSLEAQGQEDEPFDVLYLSDYEGYLVDVIVAQQHGYHPWFVQLGTGDVLVAFDDGDDTLIGLLPWNRIVKLPPDENLNPLEGVTTLIEGYTIPSIHYDRVSNVWHFLGYLDGKMWYVRGMGTGTLSPPVIWDQEIELGPASEVPGTIARIADGTIIVAFDNDGVPVRLISVDGKTWKTWY